MIKFVSDLRQVIGFLRVLLFPPPINWLPRYNWNIVESDIKHHKIIPTTQKYACIVTYMDSQQGPVAQVLKFVNIERRHSVAVILLSTYTNVSSNRHYRVVGILKVSIELSKIPEESRDTFFNFNRGRLRPFPLSILI